MVVPGDLFPDACAKVVFSMHNVRALGLDELDTTRTNFELKRLLEIYVSRAHVTFPQLGSSSSEF